jgi:hypothetical protein
MGGGSLIDGIISRGTTVLLSSTSASEQHINQREWKRNEIWSDFCGTEAMTNREWTNANYELRHLTTLIVVHGFHHKICKRRSFHSPDKNCVCRLCDRYHILSCKSRTQSLSEIGKENWNMHILRIFYQLFTTDYTTWFFTTCMTQKNVGRLCMVKKMSFPDVLIFLISRDARLEVLWNCAWPL